MLELKDSAQSLLRKKMWSLISDGCGGFCINCGKEAREVEHDARKYTCPYCHEETLYGLEELMAMGILRIV